MTAADLTKYTQHYLYSDESIRTRAVALDLQRRMDGGDVDQAFRSVRQYVNDAAYDKSSGKPVARKAATDLLDSRRQKASDSIEVCMASCGAMSTLAASLLRSMGYAVRLVHGQHPRSTHHAWIEVFDPRSEQWRSFDVTGFGDSRTGAISPEHIKQMDCVDWSEIMDFLEREHTQWLEARREQDVERVSILEELIEFHPEFLTALPESDQEALKKFYFAGREVDVESVRDYQAQLEQKDPGITDQARTAFRRFMGVAEAEGQ